MMDMRYELRRMKEKVFLWFVWRIPKKIVYWCGIRMCAYATTGKYDKTTVPELSMMDMLGRCEEWSK